MHRAPHRGRSHSGPSPQPPRRRDRLPPGPRNHSQDARALRQRRAVDDDEPHAPAHEPDRSKPPPASAHAAISSSAPPWNSNDPPPTRARYADQSIPRGAALMPPAPRAPRPQSPPHTPPHRRYADPPIVHPHRYPGPPNSRYPGQTLARPRPLPNPPTSSSSTPTRAAAPKWRCEQAPTHVRLTTWTVRM